MTEVVIKFMSEFIAKIPNAEIYIVGGAVRDIELNKTPHDFDFTTNIHPNEIEKHFNCVDIGQSKDFGITSVQFEGNNFEVATFRTDAKTSSDSRHPDSVNFNVTLTDDLARRDFTFNAMAMGIDGIIIDPFNGRKDLADGVIRFVGNPIDRLTEDALRLFRLFRFASTFGFIFDGETESAVEEFAKNKKLVTSISIERFTGELLKVAEKGGIAMGRYISLLDKFNILNDFIPEISAFKTVFHHHEHHPEGAIFDGETVIKNGSVMAHVVSALNETPKDATKEAVLGVLFHDIGKPPTAEVKSVSPLIAHSFHGHCSVGCKVFENIGKRLKFSNDLIEEISFVIRHHMDFFDIKTMKKSKIMKIAISPFIKTLEVVCFADDMSRGAVVSRPDEFFEIVEIVDNIVSIHTNETELKNKIKERIDGNMVMRLRPDIKGKQIGNIIEKITNILIDSDFKIRDDQIVDEIRRYGEN